MSNSVDSDETALYEPSHLDLHCLQSILLSHVAVKEFVQLWLAALLHSLIARRYVWS